MNNEPDNQRTDGVISLVIFDMDGVIADTGGRHLASWSEYMKSLGRTFNEEKFPSIFGLGAKDFCPILFPDLELNEEGIRRITEEKESMFRESARGKLETFPGFRDFLNLCDEKDIPMAVGSSACRANVDFVLNELKVFQRFAVTVSSDDVVNAKPAPDIFLKAASDTGIEPSRALVIEDSLIGIASAKAAGMTVAGLSTTHTEAELAAADYVVRDFIHLKELISDLLLPGRVQGFGAA